MVKFLGKFCLLIFVAAITYSCLHSVPVNPAKTLPVKRLQDVSQYPALPEAQRLKALALLKRTDDLDEIYKKKRGFSEFLRVAKLIEDDLAAFEPTMDQNDPRRDLLVNTFVKYQNAAVLMAGKKNADAAVFAAYIPKRSLRDWLNGKLTKDEKSLLNNWLASN